MTNNEASWTSAISRRSLLRGSSALIGAAAASSWVRTSYAAPYLFQLGIASGDPDDHSVTLWTRLAPAPLTGGGMPSRPVAVKWVIATDASLQHVVQSGEVWARPELGHSIHVRPRDLESNRWYYYQFYCGSQASPIGRTRTFPSATDAVTCMRFALASCQDYQAGYYAAYRHMAEQDLDFVVHVGDYIYEYGASDDAVRPVPDGETVDLEGYRNRYALYRLDPDLQAAHAAFPFLVTFDDHEVADNYAGNVASDGTTGAAFAARRAAAYQAYFENMPLAFKSFPRGPSIRLFRRFNFGNLANIQLLDTRQYRTDQPCGDGLKPACEDLSDADATMMGETQESWLFNGLARSTARWNVLAQQIMMTTWDFGGALGASIPFFNMDAWDGYPAARERLLSFIGDQGIRNTIVLTGDIHSAWQADLKRDFADPLSPVIATEFVGTSITSDFPSAYVPLVEATLPSNPHIRFFDGLHRGYIRHEVTLDSWRAEYLGVEDPLDPASEVNVIAAFAVADGVPGAVMA